LNCRTALLERGIDLAFSDWSPEDLEPAQTQLGDYSYSNLSAKRGHSSAAVLLLTAVKDVLRKNNLRILILICGP
jgi:hypothetical protein